MSYKLSLNTGFAVNRFQEPEEWVKIVGETLDLRYAQLTADMLNPSLPDRILASEIKKIKTLSSDYNVKIASTFTGAFTRVNHLAHPNREMQKYWIEWFKGFVDITVELGSDNMGSHFGIFTAKDNEDPMLREQRRQENIENWHEVAKYAKLKGLNFLSWEPMSIKREQGETLEECRKLQVDVNQGAPLPFLLCLDVDHGDLSSKNPDDINPYVWLKEFARESPLIHLKQRLKAGSGHVPFVSEYNDAGEIKPRKVIEELLKSGNKEAQLILEPSFREREPYDSEVIPVLLESVRYWKSFLNN